MKKTFICLFVLLFSYLNNAFAIGEKVVYGNSNLIDFYQIKDIHPPEFKKWTRSVAAMFSKEILQKENSHYLIKETNQNNEETPFCLPMDPLEKLFSSQQKLSDCTAFLIGPDILATAGHCVESLEICKEKLWVFDYKLENHYQTFSMFPEKNVYECDKIVSKEHPLLDYTIIKLKRTPFNREPLKVRSISDGDISDDPELIVMGFPLGHPLKLSTQSTLRKTSHPKFIRFESDTFKGNSGSPVINVEKGWVEGILFSGESDFTYNENCKKIRYCEIGECRGEQAIRINHIPNISEWAN